MSNKRFCCLRPNFCSPCEIPDLLKLPTGYIYGIDVIYPPEVLNQYEDIKAALPQVIELNEYKWREMINHAYTSPSKDCDIMIYVRPRGCRESGKVHNAYFMPEFHGDINTCTFCMNEVCLRHASKDAPTFCNADYNDYGSPSTFWGMANRKVFDAWMPKFYETRQALRYYINSLTKHQRKVLVADKTVPIGELIVSGVFTKEELE